MTESKPVTSEESPAPKDRQTDNYEALAAAYAALAPKWPGIVSRDSDLPQVAPGGSYL